MRAWKKAWPLTILAATLAVLASGPALAGGISVGVTGGADLPMGKDFKDAAKTGYAFGASGDYGLAPMWGAGIDLAYRTFKAKDDLNNAVAAALIAAGAPSNTTVDIKWTAIQGGVHLRVTPPMTGPIKGYGQVGGAAYSLKEKIDTNTLGGTDISKTKFGYNVGAGIDYAAAPTVSVGVLAQYHNVPAKDDFGADLSWISVAGKVTFHVPMGK